MAGGREIAVFDKRGAGDPVAIRVGGGTRLTSLHLELELVGAFSIDGVW
jgi:hypothetical protein